jgi:Ni/Fe-hydrogenase subunit HybB-like protein
MMDWLLGFLLIDIALEGMELVSMLYESEESWEIISELLTEKIALSFFGIQIGIGAVAPIIILGAVRMIGVRDQIRSAFAFSCSVLVLVGVFAMRWNVVIGGQLISKSLRGFLEYNPVLGGMEGILSATGFVVLPLLLLGAIAYFLPPWREEMPPSEEERTQMPPSEEDRTKWGFTTGTYGPIE